MAAPILSFFENCFFFASANTPTNRIIGIRIKNKNGKKTLILGGISAGISMGDGDPYMGTGSGGGPPYSTDAVAKG
ncbi:MAG: hypothetical protein FWH46_05200 [Methanimicrococcus sp.]|nr:hypothetical protein [Methanimicrococcus sp.]